MRTSSRPSVCRAKPTFSVEVRIRVARKSLSQVSTHHPEAALRRIEGKATADGEGLHDLVRAEGLLAEHAGPAHGGRERSGSGEFDGHHVRPSHPATATVAHLTTAEVRPSRAALLGGTRGESPDGAGRQRAGALRAQSNGYLERIQRALLDEHPRVKGRTTWYESVDEMQADLDVYIKMYHRNRPQRGCGMDGWTAYRCSRRGSGSHTPGKKSAETEVKTAA